MGLLKDGEMPYLTIIETAAASVSNAPSGDQHLFVDTDHLFKLKNSSGTVTIVGDKTTVTYTDLTTAAAPSNPSSGTIRLYSVTGNILAYRTSSGTESQLTAFPGYATPSVALAATAAAGTAPTLLRSDATIAAFDATTPSTLAFGDTGTVGTAAFAAHRDHGHVMPAQQAANADTSGATLTQLETEVNELKAALRAVGILAP